MRNIRVGRKIDNNQRDNSLCPRPKLSTKAIGPTGQGTGKTHDIPE